MRKPILRWIGFSIAAILPILAWSHPGADPNGSAAHTAHDDASSKAFFIPNLGQWDDPSLFHFRSGPLHIFIEPRRFTYVLTDYGPLEAQHAQGMLGDGDISLNHHAFRMRFLDASEPVASGRGKQKAYHNYFIGNDQSKWKSEVPLYQGVHMQNLYPGIHLEAKSKEGSLKYDIVVNPGSDPSMVRMEYSGLDGLSIDAGVLKLKTSLGTLEERIPLAWQEIDGRTVAVQCNYTLVDDVVGFQFPEGYNPEATLVIDPVLIAATLSGSTGDNYGHGATYDLEGNIFTHAVSFVGTNYPVSAGAFQTIKSSIVAVFTKFNPLATELIWASYLGGTSANQPHSIVANNQGELYAYGTTYSNDFPVSPGAFQSTATAIGTNSDIFVTHFNMNGTALLGSTYIGGSGEDGRNNTSLFGHDRTRGEVVVDGMGNAYIATASQSQNFPTTAGCFQSALQGSADGVVFKLSPNMSTLHWSTFLGGSALENASGLRVKNNGNVVVSGVSNSEDFPMPEGGFQDTKSGGYDAFIVEITADGNALERGTFAGTENDDFAFFIDQNGTGVSIYGISEGDWPVTSGAYNSGGRTFVTRFNNNLTEMVLSARIGPNQGSLVAFMVDLCGRSYMSMYGVAGAQLDLTPDALFTSGGFYLCVLDEGLETLIFGTYGQGSHVDGGTSRFDPKGIIYQGVCSGFGSMQGTPGAWATSQSSGWDIGVFKIDFGVNTTLAAGAIPNPIGCIPHVVEFENFSEGTDFIWDFGDGSPISQAESPSHTYTTPGIYEVTLIAMDSTTCNLNDTTSIFVSVGVEVEFSPAFDYVFDCDSLSLELINLTDPIDSAFVYVWNMGDGTTYGSFEANHQYEAPGDYTVFLSVLNPTCQIEELAIMDIPIISNVTAEAEGYAVDFCVDATVAFANTSSGGTSFQWIFGDGNTSDEVSPEHTYDDPGDYDVTLIVTNPQSCNIADTVEFPVAILPPPVMEVGMDFTQTGNCEDLEFFAFANSTGSFATYSWFLNGEPIGMDNPITGNVDHPGGHELTVIGVENLCEFSNDTTVRFELINSMQSTLLPEYHLCYNNESIEVSALSALDNVSYAWQPTGEQGASITVITPGTYDVVVTTGTCVDSLSTEVKEGVFFPTDYSFDACEGFPTTIAIDFPFVNDPLWNDGHTEPDKVVTQAGEYQYSFTDHQGCLQNGVVTFNALPENPNIQIPNIITPNGDGRNDVFQPLGGDLQLYNLSILNRWGNELFNTETIYGPWNGRTMGDGDLVKDGTYYYLLFYQGECQRKVQSVTGFLQVVK